MQPLAAETMHCSPSAIQSGWIPTKGAPGVGLASFPPLRSLRPGRGLRGGIAEVRPGGEGTDDDFLNSPPDAHLPGSASGHCCLSALRYLPSPCSPLCFCRSSDPSCTLGPRRSWEAWIDLVAPCFPPLPGRQSEGFVGQICVCLTALPFPLPGLRASLLLGQLGSRSAWRLPAPTSPGAAE